MLGARSSISEMHPGAGMQHVQLTPFPAYSFLAPRLRARCSSLDKKGPRCCTGDGRAQRGAAGRCISSPGMRLRCLEKGRDGFVINHVTRHFAAGLRRGLAPPWPGALPRTEDTSLLLLPAESPSFSPTGRC